MRRRRGRKKVASLLLKRSVAGSGGSEISLPLFCFVRRLDSGPMAARESSVLS